MKKLLIAAIFGFTVVACGTKESSTSGTESDSTAVDAGRMSPSTMDTTMPTTPTDTAGMKMDSAAVR